LFFTETSCYFIASIPRVGAAFAALGLKSLSMEEVYRAVHRGRRLSAWQIAAAIFAFFLVAGVIAVQTVPEYILFHERMALKLLENSAELRPIDVRTHDGLMLRSWFHPAVKGKPVIVYFRGRNGDFIRKPTHLFQLAQQGYGLILAGYRGYAGIRGVRANGCSIAMRRHCSPS
jgi:uncharacterized protein